MSKLGCTCGHVISDAQSPNEVTGWMLSDKSSEVFFDAICETINDYQTHASADDIAGWQKKHFNEQYPQNLSMGDMIHDVLTSRFFNLTLATMECDCCGRLWVQQTPGTNHYHGYSPDIDGESRRKLLGYNSSDAEDQTVGQEGRAKP